MPATWYPRIPPFGMPLWSGAFKRLYREAIHEVLAVLDESDVTYWVTEGTLLGLLRHGCNEAPGTRRVVDEDVDVMVELTSAGEWAGVAAALEGRFDRCGWFGAQLRSTSDAPSARRDLLRCWRRGHGALIRCDIHSYIHDTATGRVTVHGDPLSYPFQSWAGAAPVDLIHPLRVVRCYDRVAPCPAQPVELLRGWNDGEYGEGSLVLAPGERSAAELAVAIDMARRLDADGFCSMKVELERFGQWIESGDVSDRSGS